MSRLYVLGAAFLWAACGPSLDDHIEQLSGSPEERQQAQHELLLAKDRAVEPLLEALGNPRYGTGRAELADVLLSLMLRVEDPRLAPALQQHLLDDPDPQVRARIAYKLAAYRRVEFADALFQALGDSAGEVRHQAMKALGLLSARLDDDQKNRLRESARSLLNDAHRGARIEAMFVVEDHVTELVKEAREQALKADLEGAESLFVKALDFSPESQRANYSLGRFYMENGQLERGMQVLRDHGMLLDVPQLKTSPQIDGRLDDRAWQQAISFDNFHQYGVHHSAAYLSAVRTRGYVGYTRDALYLGAHCYDAHPESLVVESRAPDNNISHQDLVQFYLHVDFDPDSYVYLSINSVGAITDAWNKSSRDSRDLSWNTRAKGAAHVGDDFWSVEFELALGTPEFSRPDSGDLWRFNLQRNFRGGQFSQWARVYDDLRYPDCFGFLMFQ